MMNPECEIEKELDYEICYKCKEICTFGKGLIAAWEKHKNDKWYAAMRAEIAEIFDKR